MSLVPKNWFWLSDDEIRLLEFLKNQLMIEESMKNGLLEGSLPYTITNKGIEKLCELESFERMQMREESKRIKGCDVNDD